MKLASQKIDIRIVLICRENNINFIVENSSHQIVYKFDDYKLGYIRVEVNLDENLNVSNVTLYGLNEKLLDIADNIDSKQRIFGLPIENYKLTRRDAQNTILNVSYSSEMIEEFEKANYISDTKYTENIFLKKLT